jgi:MAP/microtubule affinity-regulating kinase
MAPEVIRKENAGLPSDIWSLGVLLYVLLIGTYPFKAENDKDLYRKIERAHVVIPEHVGKQPAALLRRMLCLDATRRPT